MIDAQEDEPQRSATLLDWIKGLGLPIASLFVSGAIFFLQSQQQAFERQLSNIEDGYRFYFEHRTTLERHVDADQEETLLKLISGTFPNVFCNVRSDLHSRVAAAEASDAPSGFGEDDREILLAMITARDAPERMPLSATADIPVPWKGSTQPPKCPPLDGLDKRAVGQSVAATDAGAVVVPMPAPDSAPASATPSPSATEEAAKSDDAAPAAAAKDIQRDTALAAATASPTPQLAAKARSMVRSADARMFRVFFQISDSGARNVSDVDPLRGPLAMNSFRAMRGVETVANMPSTGQIRYFGPDEEARALDLAEMLNAQYKSEGLSFKTVAIGEKYPNMPKTTLEVWLPDPVNAKPATPHTDDLKAVDKLLAPDALKKLSPLNKAKSAPVNPAP